MPGRCTSVPATAICELAPPGRILLDGGPRIAGYRPMHRRDPGVGGGAGRAPTPSVAILTGMGSDGARGVMAIQENGGLVIAQDEATSVIFGMPAEAIKTGAVEQVLPLEQIAAAMTRRLAVRPGAVRVARSMIMGGCVAVAAWCGRGERERTASLVCLAPGEAGCGHGGTGDPVYRGRHAFRRGSQPGGGDSRS